MSRSADPGTTAPAAGTRNHRETGLEAASISVPDDATDEEVAAIVAAIGSRLREEEQATEEAEDPARVGDRWTLSNQLMQVGRQPANIPPDVPSDQWVAAGRVY